MAQIRSRPLRTLRSRNGLISFASIKTSQNGEDGIIAEIFRRIPRSSPTEKRWCVDVGAWDGVHLSNTWSLLVEDPDTWSGILIEADPKRSHDLKALHEPLGNLTVTTLVSCLPNAPRSLSNVLQQTHPTLPTSFDFISIDVDGADYWLMDDLLQRYTPQVICVEFNPSIPDEVIYIQARDDAVRHGSSLAGLVELATSHGYTLIETCVFNAFFVPNAIYTQCFQDLVPDTSIEVLHDLSMGTKMYQLYDGTLKLAGCKILLQHRIKIDEAKIQIIPPEQRSFPFRPPSSPTNQNSSSVDEATIAAILAASIDMSCMANNHGPGPGPETKANEANQMQQRQQRQEQSDKLWDTLARDGFAYVRGTGINRQLCQDTLDATFQYFVETTEKVRRSATGKERSLRGYSPMNTENFASLIGEQAPNDCVRKFRMGNETKPCGNNAGKSSSSLHQSNAWPDSNLWPEYADQFRLHVTQYYDRLRVIGTHILHMILDGMKQHGYAENAKQIGGSNETAAATTDILTLLGYKGKKKNARKKNKEPRPLVAAHTDVGVITILLYEPTGDCAKLQRKSGKGQGEEGNWIDVDLPPLSEDPVFVVNIGDCLSDMTDGTLPSTVHRVILTGRSRERQCLAMFVGLNPEVVLQVVDAGEASGGGENTVTMTYEAWRRQRVKRAQASLNLKKNSDL